MKRTNLLLTLFFVAGFIACKKDKSPAPSSASITGIWEGKWGDMGATPGNFIKFDLKNDGTLTRLNQDNQIIANGNWTVDGVQFECTYTHTDGQTHKIGGLYTDFDGNITGTWGYSPSKANGGTIELKKK